MLYLCLADLVYVCMWGGVLDCFLGFFGENIWNLTPQFTVTELSTTYVHNLLKIYNWELAALLLVLKSLPRETLFSPNKSFRGTQEVNYSGKKSFLNFLEHCNIMLIYLKKWTVSWMTVESWQTWPCQMSWHSFGAEGTFPLLYVIHHHRMWEFYEVSSVILKCPAFYVVRATRLKTGCVYVCLGLNDMKKKSEIQEFS